MPSENLLAMYESKPAARKLFDSIVEAGVEDNRTTVDEIIQGGDVTRRQAITLLRDLDEAGYGEFKVGRKGHPSRLEWREDPRALAQRMISGGLTGRGAFEVGDPDEPEPEHEHEHEHEPEPEPEQPRAPVQLTDARPRELFVELFPAALAEPPAPRSRARPRVAERPRTAGLIEHTYVLRPKLRVVVELPEDLSAREAEILADWIRNLSFER